MATYRHFIFWFDLSFYSTGVAKHENHLNCMRSIGELGLSAEGLFVAIYRWRLKPGHEESFRKAWAGLTRLIYLQLGSFGSRLHKAEDGSWYAYAQWPDRKTWEQVSLDSDEAKSFRSLMRDAVAEDFEDILLEVTDDLLFHKALPPS